ncbi:hypothetical protein AeMF1_005434 [Aphanomyces euteiches]|nr:hypothetical protein AeMF1_005434 [Aphanomyces euteiches]KAH9182154.1 hypothetical protein AeNC1_015870 [Aphanomyces euteiches]
MWTSFEDAGNLALPLAATASSIYLASFILRFLWKAHKLRHIPQPKTRSWLFGNALDSFGRVAQWHETGEYPEPFLGWVEEFGNAVRLREFFKYTIMLTDPKALQHLYSSNANNYRRTDMLEDLLADFTFGPGLLSTRGSVHDHYHKILNPLFSAAQIKNFIPIYEAQGRHACDTVFAQAAASGKPFNLYKAFTDITLRVIGLAGFGFNFEDHPEAHEAYEMIPQDVTPLTMIGIHLFPHFFDVPLPGFLRRRKAQVTLRRVVNEVIEKKLAQNNPTDKPKDLLDLVLPQFSTQEAVIHTMTFLSAGHETSSSALSWIFATICPRQDVVLRIRKEYKDVMSKHGSLSTWEASSQLKYTMAVIQETMRLNGVLHIIGTRVSINDDTFPMLDGTSVFIPAGTEVVVNLAALHRNPKYWTSADAFIPERFIQGTPEWDADLKLRDGKSHAFYYMPFGMGATSCIGQRFAMAEIQVLLAMIAGEFDVKLTPNANVRQNNNAVTLAPANLEVTIQRAETSSVAAA